MDATDIDLGYWHLRLDGAVLELLMADGTSDRIHARHVTIEAPAPAVDQRQAPGGISVVLHSIRRGALWGQFDVPAAQIPAVEALLAQVVALGQSAG